MLELLVGEAYERFECDLVAEPMTAAQLEHLRADVALDQAEDVGVAAALDLADQAALVGTEESQILDLRKAVGQELFGNVELAAADDIAVDVPADALGYLDALGVAGTGFSLRHGLHDVLRQTVSAAGSRVPAGRAAKGLLELASRCASIKALTGSRCVIGSMCPAPGTTRKAACGSAVRRRAHTQREGSVVPPPCTSNVGSAMSRTSSSSAGSASKAWKSSTTLASCGTNAARFSGGISSQLPGPLQ